MSDKQTNDFSSTPEKMKYKVSKIGKMPSEVSEASGLEIAGISGDTIYLWTHNDSGGKPELYKIDQKGNLQEIHTVPDTRNFDWEELAQDSSGNIFIGDIGNNSNRRKELKIYKYSFPDLQTISFSYQDQKDFPPDKRNMNYDCEAFFWHNDSLYLFSKNRGNKMVKMYALPDVEGVYSASVIDSTRLSAMITAADINPSHTMYALLGYGKVYLFGIVEGNINFSAPYACRRFGRSAQAEALVFINESDFIVCNEQGKIFLFTRKKGKDKLQK
ncbi:MAG: hypothetical protein ACK4ND_12605 [Cytophagaceae bacterium]